jgi:hypothetical protein
MKKHKKSKWIELESGTERAVRVNRDALYHGGEKERPYVVEEPFGIIHRYKAVEILGPSYFRIEESPDPRCGPPRSCYLVTESAMRVKR